MGNMYHILKEKPAKRSTFSAKFRTIKYDIIYFTRIVTSAAMTMWLLVDAV
jgi:hypothetical protein